MMIGTVLFLMTAALNLTPAPQEMTEEGKGEFILQALTPIIVEDDASDTELAVIDAFLKALHADLPVLQAGQFKPGNDGIYIGEPGRHAAFEKRPLRTYGERAAELKPGGYVLSITRKMVVVAGRDPEGAFHGLQTLLQIARAYPQGWPCIDIKDWPNCALRGVWADKPLSEAQLVKLASVKANCVVYDSPGFCALTGEAAETWKRAFAAARQAGLEPIPVLRFLNEADGLLAVAPIAAEGCILSEEVTLSGEDWSALKKRNVLPGTLVSVSGAVCRDREDYALEPAPLEYPYAPGASPCLIRSIPGGKIPDGATARVTYSYAPEKTAAMCPNAPETAAALEEAMRRLNEVLKPRYLHLGMETLARLNQDFRCRAHRKDNAGVFEEALNLAASTAKKAMPGVQLMIWSDSVCPAQDAPVYGLDGAAARLPENLILSVRLPQEPHLSEAACAWCAAQGRPYMLMGAPEDTGSGGACEAASKDEKCLGVLAEKSALVSGTSESLLAAAWKLGPSAMPWPEGLNAFFGVSLEQPDYPKRYESLTAALNARTIRGKSPEESYQEFRPIRDTLARRLPKDDPELAAVDRLYANLTTYLTLENAYTERQDKQALRRLVDVVKTQAELDPELNPDRMQRIIDTIENQGLFVPASILFGGSLAYYRPITVPAGYHLLEVPGKPEYHDEPQHARADWNLVSPYALRRIDYETVGARRVTLECGDDGKTYKKVRDWNPSGALDVRGPAIVEQMPASQYVRLSVESTNKQAVLREARLYGLKGPAALRCPFTSDAGRTRISGTGSEWSGPPQAIGFVDAAAQRFAEAPTEIRAHRTRTHLFLGVTAKEPRMHAMTADMTTRDAPLWEQESVEVWIDTGAAPLFRFVANPLGAQFDSCGGDDAWDASWQVMAEKMEDGWAAVLAIPFEAIGGAPQPSAAWRVNFVRNRANVTRERSLWAFDDTTSPAWPMGTMTFE